jgi:hypothetical protein
LRGARPHPPAHRLLTLPPFPIRPATVPCARRRLAPHSQRRKTFPFRAQRTAPAHCPSGRCTGAISAHALPSISWPADLNALLQQDGRRMRVSALVRDAPLVWSWKSDRPEVALRPHFHSALSETQALRERFRGCPGLEAAEWRPGPRTWV